MRSPVAEEVKVYLLVATAGARRTCPPSPTRRCACVGRTVRRTRSWKKRRLPSLSTSSSTGCPPLSEPEVLKIAKVGKYTDVEGLCHFAAIVPKDGDSRSFPIHLTAPPLYMCKARVHVCEQFLVVMRAIPGSNVPSTMTVTSLQLHCLQKNLNASRTSGVHCC